MFGKAGNGLLCHHTGFKTECAELRDRCPKWVRVLGTHPQTGATLDEYRCADAWMPILLIENTQQSRQAGAAIESFRNEMVKSNRVGHALLARGIAGQHPIPEKDVTP